jgi:hypothetical protein
MADDKVYLDGNGNLRGFTICNPKYLGCLGSPNGLSGYDPPPHGPNGWPTKTLFTLSSISWCKLTNSIALKICGLNLTPSIVWTNVKTNGGLGNYNYKLGYYHII